MWLKGGYLGHQYSIYISSSWGYVESNFLVWLQFKPHYEAERKCGNILATFLQDQLSKDAVSTIGEILGTFVLVLTIFRALIFRRVSNLRSGGLWLSVSVYLGGTTEFMPWACAWPWTSYHAVSRFNSNKVLLCLFLLLGVIGAMAVLVFSLFYLENNYGSLRWKSQAFSAMKNYLSLNNSTKPSENHGKQLKRNWSIRVVQW